METFRREFILSRTRFEPPRPPCVCDDYLELAIIPVVEGYVLTLGGDSALDIERFRFMRMSDSAGFDDDNVVEMFKSFRASDPSTSSASDLTATSSSFSRDAFTSQVSISESDNLM